MEARDGPRRDRRPGQDSPYPAVACEELNADQVSTLRIRRTEVQSKTIENFDQIGHFVFLP
jgi:hypothetical protein